MIAESADGRKDEVAWAKIYFAYTTERYELLAQSEEDALRIEERQKLLLKNAEACPYGGRDECAPVRDVL